MAPVAKKQKSKEFHVVEFHPWDELPPEILGLIFQFLSLKDRLVRLPCVCKSWLQALKGPYCWKEIDIYSWSSKSKQEKRPQRINRMLRSLIKRSGDSFVELRVSALSSMDMFTLIADNAKNLQTLELSFSKISGRAIEKIANKLTSLASLDISQCEHIGSRGLEAFGKNCKNLTTLCYYGCPSVVSAKIADDQAHAIANTMPKLKTLDISYFQVGTKAVMEIMANCKELELLNIRGCWAVIISEKYLERFPNLKIVGACLDNPKKYHCRGSFCSWGDPSYSDDEDDFL